MMKCLVSTFRNFTLLELFNLNNSTRKKIKIGTTCLHKVAPIYGRSELNESFYMTVDYKIIFYSFYSTIFKHLLPQTTHGKPKLNYKSKKRLMCHLLVYSPKQQKKEKRSFNPSMGGETLGLLLSFRIFSQGVLFSIFQGPTAEHTKVRRASSATAMASILLFSQHSKQPNSSRLQFPNFFSLPKPTLTSKFCCLRACDGRLRRNLLTTSLQSWRRVCQIESQIVCQFRHTNFTTVPAPNKFSISHLSPLIPTFILHAIKCSVAVAVLTEIVIVRRTHAGMVRDVIRIECGLIMLTKVRVGRRYQWWLNQRHVLVQHVTVVFIHSHRADCNRRE